MNGKSLRSPVIDYHTVGEDIITASNTVDNDETHADSNQWNVKQTYHVPEKNTLVHPNQHDESYYREIRQNQRRCHFPGIVGALSRNGSMNVMRAINGVRIRARGALMRQCNPVIMDAG